MMGSAYNFRRAVEEDGMKVFNMTNFSVALALQAGAMGVPFLPTRTALGSDITKGNHFFYQDHFSIRAAGDALGGAGLESRCNHCPCAASRRGGECALLGKFRDHD